MGIERFLPDSQLLSVMGLELELIRRGASAHRDALDSLREEVITIAARSRGWDDTQTLDEFRRNFKIGPLYETNALALLRDRGRLVGLAGTVNNWEVGDRSIVHLCSVGLLPEYQNRGVMPVLMGILWVLNWQDPTLRRNYAAGRAWVSAITQSPYMVGYLDHLFEIHPSPHRGPPDEDTRLLARAVVARFDDHIPLDEDRLILRDECNFFYRELPPARDPLITRFCQEQLRVDHGDVFVVIGRVTPRIEPYVHAIQAAYPEAFQPLADPEPASSSALAHGALP